jgi:ankyrin repeat protein
MALTPADIINAYKQGIRYNMQGTKPRFLVAMGMPNKARVAIQLDNIKQYISSFLMNPVDINIRGYQDNTALHIAIIREMTEVVRCLIEDGADIEAVNRYGSTPLHASATARSSDCMQLLLKHGANLHAMDINNKSPMDVAFESIIPEIQDTARFAYLI